MTSRHTRTATVAACRRIIQAGRLRPPMRACCARAGWSVSTGHRTFGPVTALHRAAIDGVATKHAILRRILGAERGALGLNAGRRLRRASCWAGREAAMTRSVAWAIKQGRAP